MGSNTVPLPDLRTEDGNVRSLLNTWVKNLVADYSSTSYPGHSLIF